MSTFAGIAQSGSATLTAMALAFPPRLSPLSPACSWRFLDVCLQLSVHNLRVQTVELDNFAQELIPRWKPNTWPTNES